MSQCLVLKYRGGIFYSHEDDFLLIYHGGGRGKEQRGGGYTERGMRETNEDGKGEQASGSEYKWRERRQEHFRP